MFFDFETTTYGKWILAGEHAVVRGHEAIVFPLKDKYMQLQYQAKGSLLEIECPVTLRALVLQVLEHGLSLLGQSLSQVHGSFHLENSIPIGAGMGASAALCVALSRWLVAQNWVDADQIQLFAKELEHLFHGTSSGLDIAGVSAETAVYFQTGQSTIMQTRIKPYWYLSFSNAIGKTAECIAQVKALWQDDPLLAQAIDQQMSTSVQECRRSLETGETDAIKKLAQAINTANDCFSKWGLISQPLQQHLDYLTKAGAIAVKPTGSGWGGYVLSLWYDKPSLNEVDLIAV